MRRDRLRQIRAAAETAGALIASVRQGRKHARITLENGAVVTCGLTPSDWRANLNLISDLKAASKAPP